MNRHVGLSIAVLAITACGSSPSHSASDYRDAILFGVKAEAYQDTYVDDDMMTLSGKLRFRDGSSQSSSITVLFAGVASDPAGYCVFQIDDDRALMSTEIDAPNKVVKRCDGTEAALFQLAGKAFSVKAHIQKDSDGLADLHIDELRGPEPMQYYKGHSPASAASNDDGS